MRWPRKANPASQGCPWSLPACRAFALAAGDESPLYPRQQRTVLSPYCPGVTCRPPLRTARSPRLTADHHHPSPWHMVCTLQALAKCMHDVSESPRMSTLYPHLDASMTTQVEVKLGRVGDFRVHGCACWNVSALPNLEQHNSPLDRPGTAK